MGKPELKKNKTDAQLKTEAIQQKKFEKLKEDDSYTQKLFAELEQQNQQIPFSKDQHQHQQFRDEQPKEAMITKEDRQKQREDIRKIKESKKSDRNQKFNRRFQFNKKGQPIYKNMVGSLYDQLIKEREEEELKRSSQVDYFK